MLDSPGSNEALQQTRELKRPSKRDQLNLSKRHAPHPISEMRLERARPAADICLLRRPQLSGAAPSTASWPAPGAGTHHSVFSQGDFCSGMARFFRHCRALYILEHDDTTIVLQ